jgi:hypothetical protein
MILAHLAVCIMWPVLGNRYMLQTYINTYYVTSDYTTACIVYIGAYTMSAHLAVCIMWPVLGKQVHVANLYRHILYHFWLDDSMYCTYRDIYYISPSGCVHYVACIGNRYTLQTYIDTCYITSDYMTACIIHIGTYINISPSGCVHYVACIGNRYILQNLYRHNNICEYMIACNVHIATYILISFRLAVCIM